MWLMTLYFSCQYLHLYNFVMLLTGKIESTVRRFLYGFVVDHLTFCCFLLYFSRLFLTCFFDCGSLSIDSDEELE